MRQKMGMGKYILQFRTRRIVIVAMFLLWAVVFLTQCSKEDAPEATIAISETLTPSITTDTTISPDSTPPFTETPLPTETPAPTATPTEGEKAAEETAEQFVPEYFSNEGECHKAVAEGTLTKCMYTDSIQDITRPEWEQLFPNTEFYLIRLIGYAPEDEYQVYNPENKLVAWKNEKKYEAESFDQLLKTNNINVNDENRELIAKAFALMTLPNEYHQHEIVFTNWKTIDIQGVFHYNYKLQAWTKLGGVEVVWFFVFDEEYLQAVSGGIVQNNNVGDYIYIEFVADIVRTDYRFNGG